MAVYRGQLKANLFHLGKRTLPSLCQPLPVRGQLSPGYTMPQWFCVPVQRFPACCKWCPTETPLTLDTMMLWSDPCFSVADLSPSLGDKLMKLTALLFPDLWLVQGYSLFQWEGQNQSVQLGGTKKKKKTSTARWHFEHFYQPAQLSR